MTRLGLGSFVSLGTVSGYTTDGVAADTLIDLRLESGNINVQYERDRIEFENMDTIHALTSMVQGGQERNTGSLTFKLTYGDLADILRLVTGHDASIVTIVDDDWIMQPPNSATHYHLDATTPKHIVLEVFSNDAVNSVFYQGLEITNAQFVFEGNGHVTCTLTFLGARHTRSAKTASGSFKNDFIGTPTGQAALLLELEGTRYRANSVTVSIDMPLEHRYDIIDKAPSAAPMPSGKRVVTVEADIEYPAADVTLLSVLEDPAANFFDATSGNTIQVTGSGTTDFLITLGDLFVNPPVDPRPEGIGVMRASLSMVAKNDGTLQDILFHAKSDEAAYRT